MTSIDVHSPARLVVDLRAIRDNVAELARRASGARLLAVVKGDAYGHGLVPTARAALAGGATWLGTAQLAESLALRAAGIDVPVISWLHGPGADFARALEADVDLGVSAPWALAEIEAAAVATGRVARLHVKIDTGLGRNGAFGPSPDGTLGADARSLLEAAAAAEQRGTVRVVGLMSHFVESDAPGSPTIRAQQDVFERTDEFASGLGLAPQVRHMANSAATLTVPDSHYDLVRPGLAIYGLSPVPQVAGPAEYGLRPAMTFVADVANVKSVPAGQGVSYGHTYVTPGATRLALLPVGYADGVPRHASGSGPVLVGGLRTRLAGRVCMDQVVVDIGPPGEGAATVECGDEAVLFGDGANGGPTAQDWADAAGTISYEIVTRMSGRLPRVYLGADEVGMTGMTDSAGRAAAGVDAGSDAGAAAGADR